MEIRQLKYFVEVCRHRSFSQAAEACYISVQGISMSIQRLEKEISQKLFRRTARGVALTPQAEFLYPRAVKIIELMGECTDYFSNSSSAAVVLPVSFSTGTIEEFAGTPIALFEDAFSGVRLDIREAFDTACDEAVENQETELGLTVGPVDKKKFHAELLFTTKHALIVHKDHPLARNKTISVHELRDVPVTVLKDTTKTYTVYRQACNLAGFEPQINSMVDNILLVYYFAEENRSAGISTVALANRLARPMIRAIPFEDPLLDWNIFLIKRKNAVLSREAAQFERIVLKYRDEMLRNGEN